MVEAAFTIFVVDDDQNVLRALARLLRSALYSVQTFASAHEFLEAHDPSVPGCALLDLSLPDIDGLELQAELSSNDIERPIIFITGRGDIPTSVRAMQAGAVDFLTKPVREANLIAAIERAASRDAKARKAHGELEAIRVKLARLTPRESEVLARVVAGRLNKQIAAELGTVEKTIKVHRSRMMEKLGLRSVADLVRLAERAGIDPQALHQ
jgi:FixJ family two-component response regulator